MRILIMFALLALTSGARTPATPVRPPPFLLQASIRELMDSIVDPAADSVWESVSITMTKTKRQEVQPRTPEEWAAIRRSAIALIEATNLLIMEGRRIAPADAARRPFEASNDLLQRRFEMNHPAFVGFAQNLRARALLALQAIDARNPRQLLNAGADLDGACEACHQVFWYPPDITPQN